MNQISPTKPAKLHNNGRRRFGIRSLTLAAIPLSISLLAISGCAERTDLGMSVVWRDGGIKDPLEAFQQLSTNARGFVVGSAEAPRVAYVVFDPLCPHCAALWRAVKPVAAEGKVRFFWIPAAVVSQKSFVVATSIYQADDPVVTMDAHELLMSQKKGGMSPNMKPNSQSMTAVQTNGDISMRLGLQEVPLIVMIDQKGKPIVSAGSLTEARLRDFLAR